MSNLDDLIQILQDSRVMFGVSPEEDVEEVISTGSPSLDIATDVGGIPVGRLTTIFGPGGSGKTTLAMHVAKNALASGKRVIFVDIEATFNLKYFKDILGDVSSDNFVLVQPSVGSNALVFMENVIIEGEADLIILDSVGALSSDEENAKDSNERTIAPIARMISPFLRKVMPSVRKNDITLLFLNQVRSNIGNLFVEHIMPGGNVLNHQSSLIIKLSRNQKIKEGQEEVGQWVKARIEKSKVGRPGRQVIFPVMYGKGIDKERDIVEFSAALGVMRKAGVYIYLVQEDDDKEPLKLGRGIKEAANFLKQNPEVYDLVFERCKQIFVTKGGR